MESFFLSETLKYLYLLYDEDNFIHKGADSLLHSVAMPSFVAASRQLRVQHRSPLLPNHSR